jgi:hypothetical protein
MQAQLRETPQHAPTQQAVLGPCYDWMLQADMQARHLWTELPIPYQLQGTTAKSASALCMHSGTGACV